jgi:hypothetical protein
VIANDVIGGSLTELVGGSLSRGAPAMLPPLP